jgi:hypothetical protein
MKLTLHLTLPPLENGFSPAYHFSPIALLLDQLVEINRDIIRKSHRRAALGQGAPIPPLALSGIRYNEDPPGEENWGDIYYCLTGGTCDCNNLVLWRAAELLEAGYWCRPIIKWQHLPYEIATRLYPARMLGPDGLWLVHCLVQFSDGSIEDISKILGMGGSYTNAA